MPAPFDLLGETGDDANRSLLAESISMYKAIAPGKEGASATL